MSLALRQSLADLELMRHAGLPITALFVLSACASTPPSAGPSRLDHIIFDFASSPFCDTGCRDRRYTIISDGTVWAEEGRWHSGVTWGVQRQIEIGSPARYTMLRDALVDFRPSDGAVATQCRNYEMDLPQFQVTWVEAEGSTSRTFADGCVEDRPMNSAVVGALRRVGAIARD